MKILHVIDSGGLYGAEVMLVSLASEQLKMGLQPEIGSIRKPGLPEKQIEKEARSRGIKVREFPMRPGVNFMGARRILQYSRKGQFNILHSHGYKANIMLGLIPSCIRQIPIISTLHGWTSTGGWTKMRFNEALDALSLRFVDRIVLVNQGMLDKEKVQRLPNKKLSVINNGIEVEGKEDRSFKGKVGGSVYNQIRQFCDQGPVIGTIGRLSKEKGLSYIVEAVRILRQEHGQNVRLLLVGEGRLRNELQNQAEQCGLNDSFLITGYVKNARDLLRFFDVYAIASLTEGLPITLLEAMASKTPVVATRVGGIPYVVENRKDGLLVESKDAQALALSVQELLHDDLLKNNLSENAFLTVTNKYSSKKMAADYSDVYRDVL